jgi:hypothetical protein
MHRHRASEALAAESELAVHQCGHGLIHLRVNRITLTLTRDEFRRLAMLVGEAHIRLGTREAVSNCLPTTH